MWGLRALGAALVTASLIGHGARPRPSAGELRSSLHRPGSRRPSVAYLGDMVKEWSAYAPGEKAAMEAFTAGINT